MTAILSFLCSEPLLSACHPRRSIYTSESDYLLDSESWDGPEVPTKLGPRVYAARNQSCTRQHRFQRLISFVSALNPLKLSRVCDEQANCNLQKQKLSSSQTVSFAAVNPTSSGDLSMPNDEDYDIRHFSIIDIVPGGKPLFISDARHCDRSKWFSQKSAQSFDAALRRRRSLSCACMNRRAYSLNKMAELDASSRRAAYGQQRANRRPESAFVDANAYNGRSLFYAFDENVDPSDLLALEWNHPARGALFESKFFEATTPPRPPKPRNYRDSSTNSRTYINEIKPPPRPPKKFN